VPDPDGTTAVIRVPESFTWNRGLGALPKHTISAKARLVPLMVTREPPAPARGAIDVTEAGGASGGVASAPVGPGGPMPPPPQARPPEASVSASAA
jgi:hypothetical protein